MANPEQLALLQQNVQVWNAYKQHHTYVFVDLTDAQLKGVNLEGFN